MHSYGPDIIKRTRSRSQNTKLDQFVSVDDNDEDDKNK